MEGSYVRLEDQPAGCGVSFDCYDCVPRNCTRRCCSWTRRTCCMVLCIITSAAALCLAGLVVMLVFLGRHEGAQPLAPLIGPLERQYT